MENYPEKWRYGVPKEDQPKLQPLLEGLERLWNRSLMAAMVVAAFHRRRVLPLMAQRRRLFETRPDEPIEGIRMSASALFDEEILCRVRETVEGWLKIGGLTPFAMRPSQGYLSLGMRDVRASPPPVPKDVERWAVNRAHAEAQKRWKDAAEAKRKRKILEREELEKCHRQQRQDSLPVEASPSPSLSSDSSDGDDECEMGRGPLDHLPDVGETVLGASASSPALLGGGEDASGPATARPEAEADTPKARALGKRVVSPVGSMAEVEQVAAGATQLPLRRVEGAPESGRDRPAPADIELEASGGGACLGATQVAQGEHGLHRSMGGGGTDRHTARRGVGEGRPEGASRLGGGSQGEARESDGTEAPSIAEATEGETEAPRTSEADATEAGAPKTTKAEVAGTEAPETTEAGVVGAGVSTVKPVAQEVEAEAGQASILPPVQGPPPLQESTREVEVHSISSDNTSRVKEVVDAKAASTMEQPALTSELEKEVTRAAEASIAVQVELKAEIGEHNALQSAALRERLRGAALHAGIKRSLAVVSSHYADVDLEAVSDGYVLPEDDEEADEEVAKLMEAAEGPNMALAKLFEEEVVPPMSSTNAGDPEP
ncbi:uncharacterized protein [Miscanthus floridulus]|uniref:uncharacterized protein n=1 Tax=Miscanthus floridulus TaxID=154761 RepID=UPI0034591B79